MTSLKVCHAVVGLQVGGAETLVAAMVRSARNKATQTRVACLDEVGVLGEALRQEGHDVDLWSRKPGFDWKLVGRLRQAFRADRPDVVHAHQYAPWFYVGAAAAREGIPLVFTVHGSHQHQKTSWKRVLFNRWLTRYTAAITAVSRSVRADLSRFEKLPAERIEVLYNGVDHLAFAPDDEKRRLARQALGLKPDEVAIGHAGRHVAVKNQAMLLRALAGLKQRGVRARAFLAGTGPLENDLRQQIEQLSLQGDVELLGQRRDLEDLMKAWDVFVLSSRSEGTSVTLLEAMSTGVPVVATAVGGNPELITGENGLLVASDDDAELSEALASLCQDPALRLRMGRAGREAVMQRFRHDAMVDRFYEIYREVLAA